MTDRDGGRAGARQPQRQQDTWERVLRAGNGAEIGGLLRKIGIPGPPGPGSNELNLQYELVTRISKPPTQEELDLLIPFVNKYLDGNSRTEAADDPDDVEYTTLRLIAALDRVHRQAAEKAKREAFIAAVKTRANELAGPEPQQQVQQPNKPSGLISQLPGLGALWPLLVGVDAYYDIRNVQENRENAERTIELFERMAHPSQDAIRRAESRIRNWVGIPALIIAASLSIRMWMATGSFIWGLVLGVAGTFGLAAALLWIAKQVVMFFVDELAPFLDKDRWWRKTWEQIRLTMDALGIKNTAQVRAIPDLRAPLLKAINAELKKFGYVYQLHDEDTDKILKRGLDENPDLSVDNEGAWMRRAPRASKLNPIMRVFAAIQDLEI